MEDELAALAHKHTELWERDAGLFKDHGLDLPFAYLLWIFNGGVGVSRVPLGGEVGSWPMEILQASDSVGGEVDAVATVGMGTFMRLREDEDGAEKLMSITAGMSPVDFPDARPYLISHLKPTRPSLPTRVLGAEVDSDGGLMETVDSGFDCVVLQ